MLFLSYGTHYLLHAKDSLKGYEIGKLAIRLSEKIDNQSQKSAIYYAFGTGILHWVVHQRENLMYQRKAIQCGLEGGNNFHTSAGIFSLLQGLLLTGQHLEELKTEYDMLLSTLKHINPFIHQGFVVPSIYQPLKQLLGETSTTNSFDDKEFNEITF